MTRLRGHFTMTLICVGDTPVAEVRNALKPLAEDALNVTVRAVPANLRPDAKGTGAAAWLVSVHGADRLGIVAEIAGVIAQHGGNITDLATRLSGALYVLTAEVDLPGGADPGELTAALRQAAEVLGVEVTCEPLADDEL